MPIEIERKFLVRGGFFPFVSRKERIVQAYLCATEERTVRVRIKGNKAFLTIKGPSNGNGFSRHEFEYEIPLSDAEKMLELSVSGFIDKERHYIPCGKHQYEVDVFHGDLEGLVLAELELESETEEYEKPDWVGEEVTGDKRYYNAYLATHGYEEI